MHSGVAVGGSGVAVRRGVDVAVGIRMVAVGDDQVGRATVAVRVGAHWTDAGDWVRLKLAVR